MERKEEGQESGDQRVEDLLTDILTGRVCEHAKSTGPDPAAADWLTSCVCEHSRYELLGRLG